MRVLLVSSLTVAASSVASAFTTTSNVIRHDAAFGQSRLSIPSRSPKLGSAIGTTPGSSRLHMVAGTAPRGLQMVAFPNMFAKLPWNVRKENERTGRRLRREAAKLYRELGITEDASFEEINEATDNIKARYGNDIKKQVKVDVIKDKIMQLRLEQRMGGLVGETKEARAESYMQRDASAYSRKMSAKSGWEPPRWSRGLIVKPNEIWRDNTLIYYGALSIGGLLVPGVAEICSFLSMFCATGFMSMRGMDLGNPDPEDGMMMQFHRLRGKVGVHQLFAFVIAILLFVFSRTISSSITQSIPILKDNPIEPSLINLAVCLTEGTAVMFLQLYKKPIKKKKRKQ